jgi:hypothetical protein
MNFDIDKILPFAIIAIIVATVYFNSSTPEKSLNGYELVKPDVTTELWRTDKDDKENDNTVTLTHRPSGDSIEFKLWHDYLLFPKDESGKPIIPTRKNDDGTEEPIWKYEAERKRFFFDFTWDIGVYGGLFTGSTEKDGGSELNVGLRGSPVRIWNTIAPDLLLSDKTIGVGVSFYPAPERFGEGWNHLGIGYGYCTPFNDGSSGSLFYLSFSTQF